MTEARFWGLMPSRGMPVPQWLEGWRDLVRDCLPSAPRRWWNARQPPSLRAVLDGTELRLMRVRGDEHQPIGLFEARVEGGTPLPRPRRGWREIVLELPADAVLLRRARLPAQVRDHLMQVVAYEIDRFTPFAATEVYFDARARDGSAPPGQVEFELAVCRRDQAAVWIERLRRAGAPITCLTWSGAWVGANLLPAAERPRQGRAALVLTVALTALVGLLVAAVLLSPLWHKRQEYERVERLVRTARLQAEEVPALRAELERARAAGK